MRKSLYGRTRFEGGDGVVGVVEGLGARRLRGLSVAVCVVAMLWCG